MPDENATVPDEVVAAGAVVNVATYLKGIRFPARRDEVERKARENGADDSAIEEIRYLPEGRVYHDPAELFQALGDEVEGLGKR